MDIIQILSTIQLFISVLIVVVILLQKGDSGLGTVFGGGVSESFRTKRGFEAFAFNLTIVLATFLFANTLALSILGTNG